MAMRKNREKGRSSYRKKKLQEDTGKTGYLSGQLGTLADLKSVKAVSENL